jgi:hypothetical protein
MTAAPHLRRLLLTLILISINCAAQTLPVLQVAQNGDVFINDIKVTALRGGAPPKALEIVEKLPPEEVSPNTRANLFVYPHTGLLASVRTGQTDNHCSIILTNQVSPDLPNFRYGGDFIFRGKRLKFSGDSPLTRSDFICLLEIDEAKMSDEFKWSFTLGSTWVQFVFNQEAVLNEVLVGIRPRK